MWELELGLNLTTGEEKQVFAFALSCGSCSIVSLRVREDGELPQGECCHGG